jgi:hypothetical protein
VPGCGRCSRDDGGGGGAGSSPALARALPRDAELVVQVPDLGALGDRLVRLEQLKLASFAAQLQGAASAQELVGSAMFQLGADLRSRESMQKAGLDPARGAAAVWLKDGKAYAVVAVKDEKAFRETVRRLARDRLGAAAASESEGGGRRVLSYSKDPGGPPELSMLFRDGWAYMASGDLWKRLPELSGLGDSAALATDAEYQRALRRLPRDRQVLVYVPPTSSYSRTGAMHGALLSLSLGEDALALFSVQPWPNAQASLELLRAQGSAPDLLGLAAPDAFLVARSLGSPAGLAKSWLALAPPWVERALEETGFDLEGQIFQNLEPGTVLSLSLAPTVNLATGVPELDVRSTNPFRYVHLVVAGKVKDPQKAARTLEALPKVAQRFGATLTPSTREGQRVYLTRYSQGEGAHLALVGDKAVMAAPVSRLDGTMARAKEGKPAEGLAADPAFKALFEGRPLAVAIDLERLAESVRALPSSAWGVGGFAMKASALRWLDAMGDLHAVTFRAGLAEGAVESELQLRFQAPQAPR